MEVKDLLNKVDANALKSRSLTAWRPILADECQVYVFGEGYIAKRFDCINYKFCSKDEAKEIVIDNLYALLRYKYFPLPTDEIDNRIADIVASFTKNLKTTLKKVSYDEDSLCVRIRMLPDYCIAFRNGVYDFKKNDWLFKYTTINVERLSNIIYLYDPTYTILWYLNYDFEPLPFSILETSLETFIELMKSTITTESPNYCFELIYNMSHDESHAFSMDKFRHLCEILGYTLLQSFSQHFIMLIGSGQNGKNSLFDGCLSNRLIPMATSNSLDTIENDRFITGTLENRSHNIFLESTTDAKTYSESKMIKSLTGSMYQTIESKGVQKYSSIINCKYLFAANDRQKLKFSDRTTGFMRRINVYDISYRWDKLKKYLTKGDYYDTTFSDSLSELKRDSMNTTTFVYFGMYGILSSTSSFTKNFDFNHNDWSDAYSEINDELKDSLSSITYDMLIEYMSKPENFDECKGSIFDEDKQRLYKSKTLMRLGVRTYEDMITLFNDDETAKTEFFTNEDVYVSSKILQTLSKQTLMTRTLFTQNLRKLYDIDITFKHSNVPMIQCRFASKTLQIVKE